MNSAGIFGPKLSGKTTLAKALSREFFLKQRLRSLVLDPNAEDWGKQSLVFTDEEKFWAVVWQSENCLVIVDEAAATIRRDKDLIPVFTRLRHLHHKLIVIGHSGMDLLPVMRQQFDELYLFRQPESAAKVWAETMTQKGLLEAGNLRQFEFLQTKLYGNPRKLRLQA
jgi:hypothetical protein